MNKKKRLARLAANPENTRFHEVAVLVEALGFALVRQRGSHCIFAHPEIPEQLNLQEVHGEVKAYQVRQLLKLVERYNLSLRERDR